METTVLARELAEGKTLKTSSLDLSKRDPQCPGTDQTTNKDIVSSSRHRGRTGLLLVWTIYPLASIDSTADTREMAMKN